MKTGIELITEERQRQISKEGWSAAHDDSHKSGQLARAAIEYVMVTLFNGWAVSVVDAEGKIKSIHLWPWQKLWWKPSNDNVRNLVKAGALIAAEIDRIQRKRE